MGKINRFQMTFILCLLVAQISSAQVPNFSEGTLKTYLTISPSYLMEKSSTNIYLHGNLEYYVDSDYMTDYSVAGDFYYYINALDSKEELFTLNHKTYFGVFKHFTSFNSDFNIGIQPGFALTRIKTPPRVPVRYYKTRFNPLFSTSIGYNYFFYKNFHFLAQARYSYGRHDAQDPTNLSSLDFSLGLGFQFKAKKSQSRWTSSL